MKSNNMNNRKQGTKAVWGGQSELFYHGSTEVPVVNSVTFGYDNVDDWFDVASGKKEGYIYSRSTNPTVAVFEEKVRVLENALKLAEHLQKHKKIEQVFYPGLESHPGHKIASGQMTGFGGVLAFSVKGDFDNVKVFLNSLELAHLAASLGSVSTLIGPPKVTSHAETTVEERKQLGIPENLIRCALGIENIEDIIADFDQALSKL